MVVLRFLSMLNMYTGEAKLATTHLVIREREREREKNRERER